MSSLAPKIHIYSDDGVGELAEICLSGLLHLGEFLPVICGEKFIRREIQTAVTSATYEFLEIMFVLDLNGWLFTLVDEFE